MIINLLRSSIIARPLAFATLALGLAGAGIAATKPVYTAKVFASGAASGVTTPMGVAYDGTHIWVSYANDAAINGSNGSSTIIEYSTAGTVVNTYSIAGYVEGLRFDSSSGAIWAVQNPGGNSAITLIQPGAGIVSGSPFTFAVEDPTRGYASVDFSGTDIYLSYSKPVNPSDPTIEQITSSTSPFPVASILEMNATGTNIATGATDQPTLQRDPRTLRGTPTKREIVMSSAIDGQLIFVSGVGTQAQSVSFLNVVNAIGANVEGLNDVIYNDKASGTFVMADVGSNKIFAITATGLTVDSLYGTIQSVTAFAEIDPTNGMVLPLITGFAKPTGLVFIGN